MYAPRRAAFALLVLTACDQGVGHLEGPSLEVPDCRKVGEITRFEPFQLELDFLGVNAADGVAVMRMASASGRLDMSDHLAISFSSSSNELAAASPDASRTFRLAPGAEGDAELTLALLDRCRYHTAAMVAVGEITFERWGWQNGERVRGTMAFDLIDRRTGAVLGEGLTGDFDFESLTGSPYTPFAPHRY
ncbi:MAG TPA: hypothetical protein PK095_16510 [Myxococcota bacterium]|nr:hypothetical protein [Myxococcota bacterium]